MPKIDIGLLDEIAELEVQALLEGLKDPEKRTNPAFLDKVRKFLKDNNMETTPETPGMAQLKRQVIDDIPVFSDTVGYNVDRRAN